MGSHLPLSLSETPVVPMLIASLSTQTKTVLEPQEHTRRILDRIRELSARPATDPRSLRHLHRHAARQWQTGQLSPDVVRAELDRVEAKLVALEQQLGVPTPR